MSDWEDEPMETLTAVNSDSNNNFGKRNLDENNSEPPRRRRNDDSQTSSFNNSGQNYGRRSEGDFKNNDQSSGGYRNNQDGEQNSFKRRNRDDNNDNQGGFQRRNRDNSGNNFRRNDSNNDQVDGGYRNHNSQNREQNGFQRRNRDGNNDNQSFQRRNKDFQNNNQSGFQRNRDGQDQNNANGFQRRDRSENQNDFRKTDNQDNNESQNNGVERRRNREEVSSGEATSRIINGEDGEKKKEIYIPRRYNKEDEDLFENIGEGINFEKFEKIPVQVSGENPPLPITRFTDVIKDESLIQAIKKSGYRTLTPIQKYAIAVIMNKRDLMASAQTGSGKTNAFLLPIIQDLLETNASNLGDENCSPQCVIISPTRELAVQIYQQALKLTYKNSLKAEVVYGGANLRDQISRLSYGANVIAATPGRLNQLLEKEIISLKKLKYLVIDEADRMIDQGFIPEVKRIIYQFDMPQKEERSTIMVSATFPSLVQRLAQEFLKNDYVFISVGVLGSANADVKQQIIEVSSKEKRDELIKILKKIYNPNVKILIFLERKKVCDYLAGRLCESDFKTTSIHGDRLQSQREEALSTFKTGKTPICCATNVCARGLDIKDVGYVINYDLPKEIDEYIHRIGRTGRVGNSGQAISFYDPNENSGLAKDLVRVLNQAEQPIPSFLQSYSYGGVNQTDDRDTRNNDENTHFESRTENCSTQPQEDDW